MAYYLKEQSYTIIVCGAELEKESGAGAAADRNLGMEVTKFL